MLNAVPEAAEVFAPLWKVLPPERALSILCPRTPVQGDVVKIAAEIEENLVSDDLRAALWIYLDDLDKCHRICQHIDSRTGAYWHAMVHRREGDWSNSKYWLRQTGYLSLRIPGFDPTRFVDDVNAARGGNPPRLVEFQRQEWLALVNYCAQGGRD